MNLLLNSFDAVNERGTIEINTIRKTDSIIIEISDDGEGIAAENIERIFDPFFTTKDVGTGTGLGLSVCMNIIESYNGRISVESIPNFKTQFRLTLPIRNGNENTNN